MGDLEISCSRNSIRSFGLGAFSIVVNTHSAVLRATSPWPFHLRWRPHRPQLGWPRRRRLFPRRRSFPARLQSAISLSRRCQFVLRRSCDAITIIYELPPQRSVANSFARTARKQTRNVKHDRLAKPGASCSFHDNAGSDANFAEIRFVREKRASRVCWKTQAVRLVLFNAWPVEVKRLRSISRHPIAFLRLPLSLNIQIPFSHRRAVGGGVLVGDHAGRLIRKHLRVLAHRGGNDLLFRRHDGTEGVFSTAMDPNMRVLLLRRIPSEG